MSQYRKGSRVERLVRDELYEKWNAVMVVRAAGSKGPFDLVALFQQACRKPSKYHIPECRPWLIQVKSGTTRISKEEKENLRQFKNLGDVMVAYKPPRRPIEWEML